MPFTPFHFGPGLLIKACAQRWFWFTSFALANVLIDTEVLYYISRNAPPFHRSFHTYIAGVGLGVLSGAIMYGTLVVSSTVIPGDWWRKYLSARRSWSQFLQSIVAGVIGGVSHVFLDALLYREMTPYWPLAGGNALAGAVDSDLLYAACAAAGFVGLIFWFFLCD